MVGLFGRHIILQYVVLLYRQPCVLPGFINGDLQIFVFIGLCFIHRHSGRIDTVVSFLGFPGFCSVSDFHALFQKCCTKPASPLFPAAPVGRKRTNDRIIRTLIFYKNYCHIKFINVNTGCPDILRIKSPFQFRFIRLRHQQSGICSSHFTSIGIQQIKLIGEPSVSGPQVLYCGMQLSSAFAHFEPDMAGWLLTGFIPSVLISKYEETSLETCVCT